MKRDEFRRVFDNIEYTKEFTESMEEKLSTSPSVQSEDGYTEAVSGVEISRQSRIVRIAGTAAACLAIVGSCVGIGFAMKGSFKPDDDVLSSMNDNTSENVSTEIPTETATVLGFSQLISDALPYTDLSEKNREEIYEIGMEYYTAACELHLMNMGAAITLDCDYTNAIDGGNEMNYYLVQCNGLNSISDAEALYHSVFSETWEFEEDFFREQNNRLYYCGSMKAPSNMYYEGWGLSLREATDEKITYRVDAFFNDGVAGSNVSSVSLEFSLIPENGVWKVQSFIYPVEAPFGEHADQIIDSSSSDDVVIAYVRNALTEAERYTYALSSPYIGDTHFYDTSDEAYAIEQGWAIYVDDRFGTYWLLTNGKTKQDLYDEIYRYFTEDYETNFDELVIERDGKTYVQIQPIDFELFYDYMAMRDEITIKSRSDTEIVLEIQVDCTEAVDEFYALNIGMSVLPEGYRYTYPQKVVLVNTEDGWRISDYIPYSDFRMRSLYDCPEMQEYIDENGNIKAPDADESNDQTSSEDNTSSSAGINYNDYIGTWRVDGDMYGEELDVISADDTKVVFEYSCYRSFGTFPITAEIYCGGSAYFNTLGADDNINIEGNLNLNSDGTISLEIISSENSMVTAGNRITFNTKVQ